MSSNANIPGNSEEPKPFYDAAPLEPHLLYQGEILIDLPLVLMPEPKRWQLLRTKSGARLDDALQYGNLGGLAKVLDSNLSKIEWNAEHEGDFVMAVLSKLPVLVLSQNCDVENKDFIQAAPIYPATDHGYFERIKIGGAYSVFPLDPHVPEIATESFADFERIQAVHKSFLKRAATGVHFRLAPHNVRALQRAITRYFGRPNSFDVGSDLVPRDGVYLCVRCFYMRGVVSEQPRKEGEQFEECGSCTGTGFILRGS